MKTIILILATVLAAGFLACAPSGEKSKEPAGKPVVQAVNYPLAYFAERIGGDIVDVRFAKIEGDPAFWKPAVADIVAIQKADLILLNGATYAKWAIAASLPEARVVRTSAAFEDRYIRVQGPTHKHGKTGEHSHTGTAFTTWLDLKLAAKQAIAIRDAFIRRMPDAEDTLRANFADLEKDLQRLDAELRSVAARWGKTPLVGSHPVYQYFARGYGLQIRSVHWEPEEMPAAKGWAELADLRKNHPATVMLWEGKPSQSIIERLKQNGVTSVVFNPCGNRPDEGDWLSVMTANVKRLNTAVPKE